MTARHAGANRRIEMKRMIRTAKTRICRIFFSLSIIMLGLSTSAMADAVTDWNQRTLMYAGPPLGGRPGPTFVLDVAVVQLAVYDAVQAIEGDYQPYCGSIAGASGSTAAATARAARDVLLSRFLTPAQQLAINNDYNAYVMGIDPLTQASLSGRQRHSA